MKSSTSLARIITPLLTLAIATGGSTFAHAGNPASPATNQEAKIKAAIDPELTAPLAFLPAELKNITRDSIGQVRAMMAPMLKAKGIEGVSVDFRKIPSPEGEIGIYIYKPQEATEPLLPALFWTHGGGFILGSAQSDMAAMLAKQAHAIVVSVDYRLAPEHPFPAGHNDSYNAFLWTVKHAQELGIDTNRIAIGGDSAGAGMAASLAIRNRDEKGPKIALELLLYPMLDNLHATTSGSIEGYPVWSRQSSFNAWEMYLNGTPGKNASPYAAAARVEDTTDLPPTFITVGEVDLFRDEVINYAQRLMASGVPTQLAVFPGMYHGSEVFVPNAEISQTMINTYVSALKAGLADE